MCANKDPLRRRRPGNLHRIRNKESLKGVLRAEHKASEYLIPQSHNARSTKVAHLLHGSALMGATRGDDWQQLPQATAIKVPSKFHRAGPYGWSTPVVDGVEFGVDLFGFALRKLSHWG